MNEPFVYTQIIPAALEMWKLQIEPTSCPAGVKEARRFQVALFRLVSLSPPLAVQHFNCNLLCPLVLNELSRQGVSGDDDDALCWLEDDGYSWLRMPKAGITSWILQLSIDIVNLSWHDIGYSTAVLDGIDNETGCLRNWSLLVEFIGWGEYQFLS